MTTAIDGWCECGYRRSAHVDGECPAWVGQSVTRKFHACPGHDLAESLHVKHDDEQGALEL